MIETFKERDKLLTKFNDLKNFYDELKYRIDIEIEKRMILSNTLFNTSYEKYFGDLYDHPYVKSIYSLDLRYNGDKKEMSSITLIVDGEITYLCYGENDDGIIDFVVCLDNWIITNREIYLSAPLEVEREVKNSEYYPKRIIDWNDEHHMMYKLTYK